MKLSKQKVFGKPEKFITEDMTGIVETVLCRLRTDDFPVNFIEGYQRDPGSGQTAVLTPPGLFCPKVTAGGG